MSKQKTRLHERLDATSSRTQRWTFPREQRVHASKETLNALNGAQITVWWNKLACRRECASVWLCGHCVCSRRIGNGREFIFCGFVISAWRCRSKLNELELHSRDVRRTDRINREANERRYAKRFELVRCSVPHIAVVACVGCRRGKNWYLL